MNMKITRNISTEQRFFEIINSIPNPVMNLYSGVIFGPNDAVQTIAEAQNKNGVCLYRFIPELIGKSKFEIKFKKLKRELNA